PRALLARWFAELESVRPDSAHLDLDRQGLGRPDEQITTVLDVADLQPLREQAIAQHVSQTSPYDGMPAELRDDFLRTDRLVRLHPVWTGGAVQTTIFPQPRRSPPRARPPLPAPSPRRRRPRSPAPSRR